MKPLNLALYGMSHTVPCGVPFPQTRDGMPTHCMSWCDLTYSTGRDQYLSKLYTWSSHVKNAANGSNHCQWPKHSHCSTQCHAQRCPNRPDNASLLSALALLLADKLVRIPHTLQQQMCAASSGLVLAADNFRARLLNKESLL